MDSTGNLGPVTSEGYWVEVYANLPDDGDGELIHGWIPEGASVLELGCGTGRVTWSLAALGHPVTAVDHSADMLTHLGTEPGVRTVCAEIEDMHLGETYDVVLMGSYLVHVADETARARMLDVSREHLAPNGKVLVEWWPPDWFVQTRNQEGVHGDFHLTQSKTPHDDGRLLTLAVTFRRGERTWRHDQVVRRIDLDELETSLKAADLAFGEWLMPNQRWFSATPLSR